MDVIIYAILAGIGVIAVVALGTMGLLGRGLARADRRLRAVENQLEAVNPERLGAYLAERERQAEAEKRELSQWVAKNREYERQFAAMMEYTGPAKERNHAED